jgi:hypothetical protein
MPLSEVESLVISGRNALAIQQAAERELKTMGEAKVIADVLNALSEDEIGLVLDRLDEVKAARESGTPLTRQTLQQSALPSSFKPVGLEEMGEEGLTIVQMVEALRAEFRHQLRKVTGIVQSMQEVTSTVAQQTQDQAVAAECSKLLGFPVTAQLLQEWRDNGIADPLKAIPFLKAQAKPGAPAKDASGKPPPAAPAPGSEKTFDARDPKYYKDPALIQEMYANGFRPADPADAERLQAFLDGQKTA